MIRLRSFLTPIHWPLTTLLATACASTQAHAQNRVQPNPGEMPAASTPAKTARQADLTNRYRFSERYIREEGATRAAPGSIGSYRVGIIEVARDLVDNPQGAPRRIEVTRQSIFVERSVELNSLGGVAASSRTFERFRAQPEDPARMMGPRPLEGLTALVRPRSGELPLVQSLTEGRRLTDFEFEVAARQVGMSQLSALLPTQAVRLGDSWRIPRRAAQAILGDPGIQGDTLAGKFTELLKEVDGPRRVAQVTVSGKAAAASGEVTVNAEVLFTFQPEAPPKPPANAPNSPAKPAEDVIEARGAITEIRLARLATVELPGPGRLRLRSNREVILHRQLGLGPDPAGVARPGTLPAATEANSWLTYLEPTGQFSFEHPQDLLPPDRGLVAPPEPGGATLVRNRREGTDLLQIEFVPKTLGLDALKQKLAARYALTKQEVIPGAEDWLPEAEWPRMKVHRIEAAVKVEDHRTNAAPGSTRIHFDGYLVQFGQSASILAIATTSRDAVAPYRREVEQVLRSIQLAPGRPATN